MKSIIWWLRRDLRLRDNLALHQALQDATSVIPVFILDPHLMQSKTLAPARRQFLFDSLLDLDAQLAARGSRLILQHGEPRSLLLELARVTQAEAIYFHRDLTPYARKRDLAVTGALEMRGVRVRAFDDLYLAAPTQVLKDDDSPYIVYTPYRKRFEARVAVPKLLLTNGELNTPPGMASLDLPELSGERNPAYARGGEAEGQRLMREFFQRGGGIAQYGVTRNDMARDATSHLSPHLHFGTVSVRELARHAQKQASMTLKPSPLFAVRDPDGVRAWLGELIWREFYAQVLWHYPHAAYESFRPEYAELAWENDEEHFAAWCDGRTGYPIVDAAMRQLRVTGWMPNRARMITASFLTKDLLVDWRWGERHFRRHLIDADRASNNGGWQWAAGTGTDAQPFFRVFHPTEQGKRFDPAGEYVRRWVSELARVPNQYVHTPWQMPRPVMLEAGLEIGRDYPLPRVDHAEARERALKRYRMVQR